MRAHEDQKGEKPFGLFPKDFVATKLKSYKIMDKVTTNSGIPVFGEVIKLLNKQEITKIADKIGANHYSKRLDAYQHLVILLYAVIGQLQSLRDIKLTFLLMAHCIQQFGLSYMVRRSTLSDANSRRSPQFFENVYNALYAHFSLLLSDSRPVKGLDKQLFIMDSTTISLFSQIFRGTGRNAINGQKKGGVKIR